MNYNHNPSTTLRVQKAVRRGSQAERRSAMLLMFFVVLNEHFLNDTELDAIIRKSADLYRVDIYAHQANAMAETLRGVARMLEGLPYAPALIYCFVDTWAQEMLALLRDPVKRAFWQSLYDYTSQTLNELPFDDDIYEAADQYFTIANKMIKAA